MKKINNIKNIKEYLIKKYHTYQESAEINVMGDSNLASFHKDIISNILHDLFNIDMTGKRRKK